MRRVLLRACDDERKPDRPCRLERSLGVLARLDRTDEEHVAAVARSGRERRIDAVRRHRDLRLRDAVTLDDVALRPFRHGDHVVGAADGPRDDGPEREAVEQPHRAARRLEGEIVHGHDGRAAEPERKRMLEVSEIRPDAAKEPRERDGHPRLLEPRGQMKRLDSLRDEVGPARDRGEPEVGRRGRAARGGGS